MKIPFPKYEAEVVAEVEAYLDQDYQTEIIEEAEVRDEGIKVLYARGIESYGPTGTGPGRRRLGNHARPMFEPIDDTAFSGIAPKGTPCGPCGDFSRSWACPLHPEVPWDAKERGWKRVCTRDDRCTCDTCLAWRPGSVPQSAGSLTGFRPPEGLYDRFTGIVAQPVSGFSPSTLDRLLLLPDFTMVFDTFEPTEPHWLEITGETIQSAGSVQIEVEGNGTATA